MGGLAGYPPTSMPGGSIRSEKKTKGGFTADPPFPKAVIPIPAVSAPPFICCRLPFIDNEIHTPCCDLENIPAMDEMSSVWYGSGKSSYRIIFFRSFQSGNF
jgi:hypothetical protein